jgi:hypothetical protein
MVRVFSTKESTSFLDGIKKGKVTSVMLQDFTKQLSAMCRPQQWLKKSWTYTVSSGILLIIDGLLGSLMDFEINFLDYAVYTLLVIAIVIFVLGIWQLIRLGRKLM